MVRPEKLCPAEIWLSEQPIGTHIVIAWHYHVHNGFSVYQIVADDKLEWLFRTNDMVREAFTRFNGSEIGGNRNTRWSSDNLYAVMPEGMTVEALHIVYELDHAAFMRVLEPWFDPRAGELNG